MNNSVQWFPISGLISEEVGCSGFPEYIHENSDFVQIVFCCLKT